MTEFLLCHPSCRKSPWEDYKQLPSTKTWELPYPRYNVDCTSQLVWHETPTTRYTEVLSFCILQQHETSHKLWWFWSPSAHRNTPQTISLHFDMFDAMLVTNEQGQNPQDFQILLSYEWIQFRYFPATTEQIVGSFLNAYTKPSVITRHVTAITTDRSNLWSFLAVKKKLLLEKQWSFITTFSSSLQTSAAIKGNFTDSLDNKPCAIT